MPGTRNRFDPYNLSNLFAVASRSLRQGSGGGRTSDRWGGLLVTLGFSCAVAALMVGLYCNVCSVMAPGGAGTSLSALLGPLPGRPGTSWESLKVGIWAQPVWLLMLATGGFAALLGSIFIDD
jgi:hypothetical protein